VDAKPYPKSQQLSRGERRYRRKVASPKQWQAIIAAKGAECRWCKELNSEPMTYRGAIEYHHLVARSYGGDDVADNVIPLHQLCHLQLHESRSPFADNARRLVLAGLTDAEYSYMVQRAGEAYAERVYGIEYRR
jgi:hypothetical protein